MSTIEELVEAEKQLPNTGYVLASAEFMLEHADLLLDSATLLKDRTTITDNLNGLHRFVMQSPLFTSGYGQYELLFESKLGKPALKSAEFVKP